jgi:hypothetical protein
MIRGSLIAGQHLIGEIENRDMRAQQAESRRLLAATPGKAKDSFTENVADQTERVYTSTRRREIEIKPRPRVLDARSRQCVPPVSVVFR